MILTDWAINNFKLLIGMFTETGRISNEEWKCSAECSTDQFFKPIYTSLHQKFNVSTACVCQSESFIPIPTDYVPTIADVTTSSYFLIFWFCFHFWILAFWFEKKIFLFSVQTINSIVFIETCIYKSNYRGTRCFARTFTYSKNVWSITTKHGK